MNEVKMSEDLFKEIHSVLAQIPYYQIAELMNKVAQGVQRVVETYDKPEQEE